MRKKKKRRKIEGAELARVFGERFFPLNEQGDFIHQTNKPERSSQTVANDSGNKRTSENADLEIAKLTVTNQFLEEQRDRLLSELERERRLAKEREEQHIKEKADLLQTLKNVPLLEDKRSEEPPKKRRWWGF